MSTGSTFEPEWVDEPEITPEVRQEQHQTHHLRMHIEVTGELTAQDAMVSLFECFGKDMDGRVRFWGRTNGEASVTYIPVSVRLNLIDKASAEGDQS